MDIDPSKRHSSGNSILLLSLAGTLALSACGKPVTELGVTTTSPAPHNTTSASVSPTAPNVQDTCDKLQSYDVVTDADGANRNMITIPKTCQNTAIDLFNEQGEKAGQMPNNTEFDIICSAAALKDNPTFKIRFDNPERYERIHLSPTLAAQEATDYTIPNC